MLLFSPSVVFDSLWLHRLQHTRLPCPSPSTRVCSYFMCIESMMPSNHLILCHPLLQPSVFPRSRVFSNELVLRIRWPKYWSFSFIISPFNVYSELISFRIDWFHLLGTLKSPLQHGSSKASILRCRYLYGHTLTSVHDYQKKHSFDNMDLCQQSDVSTF